jgi:hypothetical protein
MSDYEAVVEALEANTISRTLPNLCLFAQPASPDGSTSIWDFKTKAWVKWEPKKSKETFGNLLLSCAKKLVKVIWFCDHACRLDDLYDYIPEEFVAEVFTASTWSSKVNAELSVISKRALNVTLLDVILPYWKQDDKFPEPFDSEFHDIEVRSIDFEYFKERASCDTLALAQFYGSIGSSVDWKQICRSPAENQLAYDWGVESLAFAADIAHRLGFGRKDHTVDTVALKTQFVAMIDETSRPSKNVILLQEDFGQERRISHPGRRGKNVEK